MAVFQDIISGLVGALTSINQSVMAISFGFAVFPSMLAYLVGILGCIIFQSPLPISFQAETLVMAGTMGRDRRERLSIVLFAGLAMVVIGALGALDLILGVAGEALTCAMKAGVGFSLCRIAVEMAKENKLTGGLSLVSCVVVYLLTGNVGYASLVAFFLCIVAGKVFKLQSESTVEIDDRFKLQRPTVNFQVIRGVLAVMCVTIGGNIGAASVTAGISGLACNPNQVSIYSGLADAMSSMFGGAPISVVISPTAAAPHPIPSAVILMLAMAVLLGSKQLPKVIKLLPPASVSGVLMVIGLFLTLPDNLAVAYSGASPAMALACSSTFMVTIVGDPFIGLVAGMVMRALAGTLGLG